LQLSFRRDIGHRGGVTITIEVRQIPPSNAKRLPDTMFLGLKMRQPAAYSVVETLRDRRSVIIRALKPEDRNAMLSAVGGVSAQSLYCRF
jgi:hypothetical protein